MIKLVKNYISKKTRPDCLYKGPLGEGFYIQTGAVVVTSNLGELYFDFTHPFNYRKVKQNKWGVWKVKDTWLGLNSRLEVYYED